MKIHQEKNYWIWVGGIWITNIKRFYTEKTCTSSTRSHPQNATKAWYHPKWFKKILHHPKMFLYAIHALNLMVQPTHTTIIHLWRQSSVQRCTLWTVPSWTKLEEFENRNSGWKCQQTGWWIPPSWELAPWWKEKQAKNNSLQQLRQNLYCSKEPLRAVLLKQ